MPRKFILHNNNVKNIHIVFFFQTHLLILNIHTNFFNILKILFLKNIYYDHQILNIKYQIIISKFRKKMFKNVKENRINSSKFSKFNKFIRSGKQDR